VSAPTLFLTGSAHPDWSPEQTQAAAERLPRGSSAVVDGAAYLLPLEAPAAFTGLVRPFWAHPTSP
jgi:pimeloyl-ACP methyl ester carboxylesterase